MIYQSFLIAPTRWFQSLQISWRRKNIQD